MLFEGKVVSGELSLLCFRIISTCNLPFKTRYLLTKRVRSLMLLKYVGHVQLCALHVNSFPLSLSEVFSL